MINRIRKNKKLQLAAGLLTGVCFGFLLQKSGVANYDVILGQLLLYDFTVVKVMLSAVVTGMIGVYLLKGFGIVRLHPKPGSLGSTLVGGLIFGAGFAIMGFCPGTITAAIGQGALDALITGVLGILLGSWLFATLYPKLDRRVLNLGDFGTVTIPEALKINAWYVVVLVSVLIILLLVWLESMGY